MKNTIRVLTCILLLAFAFAALSGCATSGPAPADDTKISIGCMPLNEPAVTAIKEMMAPKGYDIEVIVFDGNNLPAEALKADEIDSLILNHLPWIKNFNQQNNAELALVDGFAYASIFGLYSAKHTSIDQIPDNGTIIVSNDPSNMDRSLRFLNNYGLITLGEKADTYYTVFDIVENPKNLQLIEVETTSTAGSFQDADACISFSSVMRNAGFDATAYLAEDGDYVQYPTGLFVNKGDENTQWAKDIVAVTQTQEYKDKFDEIFQGAYILID